MIIPFSLHQNSSSFDVNSEPLSVRIVVGLPLCSIIFSSTLTTLFAEIEVSISIASASRVQLSITLKVLNFLLPTMLSLIIPIAIGTILQRWLICSCLSNGCLTLAGNVCRIRLSFLFTCYYHRAAFTCCILFLIPPRFFIPFKSCFNTPFGRIRFTVGIKFIWPNQLVRRRYWWWYENRRCITVRFLPS